jgi:putative hydrolase of the HAD superfamily
MIKAIVFDVGGVLIGLDMGRCINSFRQVLGFDRITEILDPYHQKGVYGEMEEGLVSADAFRAAILAESRPGCKPADVDFCMGSLLVGMTPDAVNTVKDLATRYPLYLLSNNNPIAMGLINEMFRENGIEPETTFRDQFLSYQMKLLKPGRAIYEASIARIGLPANEILFIDDNDTNVKAAREAGMKARLFVPGTSLAALLADC